MLGGHWGIVFCQRHSPRRRINSSSSTKPDREVEPPFNVGGRAWHPHRRLASFQRSNSIVTRPSQANDEVRALSVNIVELGTCWHIIECLYFLSNGGDVSRSLALSRVLCTPPLSSIREHRAERRQAVYPAPWRTTESRRATCDVAWILIFSKLSSSSSSYWLEIGSQPAAELPMAVFENFRVPPHPPTRRKKKKSKASLSPTTLYSQPN